MTLQGKHIGRHLYYIKALDETFTKEYIESLTNDQFDMFISFCDMREVERVRDLVAWLVGGEYKTYKCLAVMVCEKYMNNKLDNPL